MEQAGASLSIYPLGTIGLIKDPASWLVRNLHLPRFFAMQKGWMNIRVPSLRRNVCDGNYHNRPRVVVLFSQWKSSCTYM